MNISTPDKEPKQSKSKKSLLRRAAKAWKPAAKEIAKTVWKFLVRRWPFLAVATPIVLILIELIFNR